MLRMEIPSRCQKNRNKANKDCEQYKKISRHEQSQKREKFQKSWTHFTRRELPICANILNLYRKERILG
jgi:hypothetical protein